MKKDFVKFITAPQGFMFMGYLITTMVLTFAVEEVGFGSFLAGAVISVFFLPISSAFMFIIYIVLEALFSDRVRKYLKTL